MIRAGSSSTVILIAFLFDIPSNSRELASLVALVLSDLLLCSIYLFLRGTDIAIVLYLFSPQNARHHALIAPPAYCLRPTKFKHHLAILDERGNSRFSKEVG